MRIGLIIYGSLETVSGGYLYDRKLVEHLRRQGDEVELISLPWRSYASHLKDNLSHALRDRLEAGRWDALLQDELNHPSLFRLNSRIRGRMNAPIFSIVHHLRSSETHPRWENGLYRWVETAYLRSVDGFIFNSRTTRKAVEALTGSLEGRASVVAYPAGDQFPVQFDEETIIRRAHLPGPLNIVFVGNLIERKGLMPLLQALERIPTGLYRLKIVGDVQVDPGYTRRVQQRVLRSHLSDRVEICGKLPMDALAQLLSASHVLCVPSYYEGFGIVYLEGMGFGLPAVAGLSGAAGEIITSNREGYLVNPDNAANLAEVLIQLALDRDRLAEMGKAARRRYLAHPTWEDTGSLIRRFLVENIR